MACTGALAVSIGVLLHSLYQLFMMCPPSFSRTTFCGCITPYFVASNCHTVRPWRLISCIRPLRPVMSRLPVLGISCTDQGSMPPQRSTSLPSHVNSCMHPMLIFATSRVPRDVRRALRNCPCTEPFSVMGSSNSLTTVQLGICITTALAGLPFCTNTTMSCPMGCTVCISVPCGASYLQTVCPSCVTSATPYWCATRICPSVSSTASLISPRFRSS